MGTNFYRIDNEEHVGKRSAAGRYCWDCKITLCKDGEDGIHTGDSEWFSQCPYCGAKPVKEGFDNSTAGRELGFNKMKPKKKKGVASCSSFNWGVNLIEIMKLLFSKKGNKRVIKDEYNKKYTALMFIGIMNECPIQRYESIGQDFS